MTRPKSKACIIYHNEVNGDWLRKTLCVEHQNTRDCNLNSQDWKVFQNERVEITISCVLVSTHSDLSVFVSDLSLKTIRALKPCLDPASSSLYDSFDHRSSIMYIFRLFWSI